jgi:hypothetical protein
LSIYFNINKCKFDNFLTGENDTNETEVKDDDERISWLRRIETTTTDFIDAIPLPKHETSPSELENKEIAGPPDKT